MFVDTGLLQLGANQSHRAGGHARDGADQLSRAALVGGMFGGFDAAEAFRDTVGAAHAHHVRILQTHHAALATIGDKAHRAAADFTAMEDNNAAILRSVRCNSGT